MPDELKQHQVEFERIARRILVDVVRAKLGPLTTRAIDALHKLNHLEKLRHASGDYDFPIVSDRTSRQRC